MGSAERIAECLASLDVPVDLTAAGDWRLPLEAADHPLIVEIALRGALLRAEATVLPADVIEPRQLLFWNGQAPLVCFAENRDGEVLVCGELPVGSLDPDLLDRFLGLLVTSATRAREFVLRGR